MGLKIKISSGYALLILLLVVVIYLFRGEKERRDTLKAEEGELADMRRLTAKAYMSLLDLFSQAEVASVWTGDDFNAYCIRQKALHETLKSLKHYIHTPEQQARIDSLNFLLNEKKQLLATIMNTFAEATNVSEIVSEKIPGIVSQVWKEPVRTVNETPVPEKESEEPVKVKKKSIWNIFRKKETKSAYLKQREQAATPPKVTVKNIRPSVAIPLLHSLDREVAEKQREQQEKLFQQMDSLHKNSQTLNRKLNTLIGDFEKEASLHLLSGYEALLAGQEESFYLASGLAAFIFLLAILLYIIVYRDVNRRYRYEKALELSNRKNKDLLQSKKNMMLTIAHDLRAPLATIKGCAELLPEESKPSRQNEYAENILHTSDYMLGLINTLIEFYMLDTGKIKLNTTLFPLESLFKEIAGNFTSLARKKNLSLATSFIGLDTVANGDRQRIQQIANNLISNAFKFTKQGRIYLNAEYTGKELRFSVRDTGTGMTAEEKERIFEAFERLDNAHDISGFGLGLTICAKLVSQMKGIITVESKPGVGSTFRVSLPLLLADEHSPVKEEPDSRYPDLEGINVLAIDDDLIQLKVTGEMLNRNGIACDCCRTSWELIDKLKSREYDLLLTDIQMPETDGYGILELLRSSNITAAKQIPVLAVTARPYDESEYITCGFSGCIHKPFSMNELMDAIAGIIGKTERKRHHPDFTFILSDEDNKGEMLDLFITETRKDLAALTDALEKSDRGTAIDILHKNLPLWEVIRMDYPLSRLRKLVICPPEAWTEEQTTDMGEIIAAANKLIEYAKKIREEEYENNPDN